MNSIGVKLFIVGGSYRTVNLIAMKLFGWSKSYIFTKDVLIVTKKLYGVNFSSTIV